MGAVDGACVDVVDETCVDAVDEACRARSGCGCIDNGLLGRLLVGGMEYGKENVGLYGF